MKRFTLCAIVTALASVSIPSFAGIEKEPLVGEIIENLTKNNGFKKDELINIFSQTERVPEVIEKITKPAEAMPWHRYQKIFLQPERIQKGAAFWQANAKVIADAEKKYGVPASVIIGILGVETRFGETIGRYRVIDAMATLALDYPKRSAFFRKELEQFLILSRDEKIDPFSIMGSYAGAIGKPQFMPSSYRAYAVDFNNDGVRDLVNSVEDAVGSIAAYLNRHGWAANDPITARLTSDNDTVRELAKKGMKPHTIVADLKKNGVALESNWERSPQKTAIIELENEQGFEYWLGLNNFYVITRYNQSALYAMAVYQLGNAIAEERAKVSQAE